MLRWHAGVVGWAACYGCQLTRLGRVLSMFWLLDDGGQGMLRRHAFGVNLGDFLQVPADRAGPYSVDVMVLGWRWPGKYKKTMHIF